MGNLDEQKSCSHWWGVEKQSCISRKFKGNRFVSRDIIKKIPFLFYFKYKYILKFQN